MQDKHWRAPGDLGVAVFRVEEQITSETVGLTWLNFAPGEGQLQRLGNLGPSVESDRSSAWC